MSSFLLNDIWLDAVENVQPFLQVSDRVSGFVTYRVHRIHRAVTPYNIINGVQPGGLVVLTTNKKVNILKVQFPAGRLRITEKPQQWQNQSDAS